jgi:hypothetical protein
MVQKFKGFTKQSLKAQHLNALGIELWNAEGNVQRFNKAVIERAVFERRR